MRPLMHSSGGGGGGEFTFCLRFLKQDSDWGSKQELIHVNCDTNRQSDVSSPSSQELVALPSRPRSRHQKPTDGCHRRHQA